MRPENLRRFITGLLLGSALAGLAVLAGWQALADIFRQGINNAEQSHVLLAIPVCLWLVWLRRTRIRRDSWMPSWLGPLLILAGYASSRVGFESAKDILWHSGAILMVVGAYVTTLGPGLLRLFLPAVIALVFMLPVPGMLRHQISVPLQQVSAVVAETVMDLVGLPVTRMGNVLTVNGHEVKVAEACDGMRMVSALAIVTYAFVFSVPMRNTIRAVIVAFSPLVAIVVNVVRLIPTAWAYGYTSESTADAVHDIGGWVVLGLAVGILWLLVKLLRWLEVPVSPHNVDAS